MALNVIKRELRSHLKALLIWVGVMAALIFMMTSEFSAYYNNDEMKDILAAMPEQFLDALSMAGANLTTVGGFVSIAALYFYLMLGVYGALMGTGIIAKEERDKTAEFFMTLPIDRKTAITAKLIAGTILNLALNVATALLLVISLIPYDKGPDYNKFFLLMMVAIFILQMIFMSLGMLMASVLKRYKKVSSYMMALFFGLYILSIAVSLTDKLEKLKYVTPFKYFEAGKLLAEVKMDTTYVAISIGIICISLIGTYVFYPKRDLHL